MALLLLFSSNFTDEGNKLSKKIDFIVTLGGDGTILHTSSLFEHNIPPIISFSMGNLGFLVPFEVACYRQAIDRFMENQSTLLLRMRIECSVFKKTLGLETIRKFSSKLVFNIYIYLSISCDIFTSS